MHRFVWDLHGRPVRGGGRRGGDEPAISAIEGDTPVAQGEWMPPGEYEVKLTAGGRSDSQRLLVKADPRE